MIDQNKRELMRQAYYLLEYFEKYTGNYDYWDKLRVECESLCARWNGSLHDFACAQASAIWDLLEAEYKAVANRPA